MPTSTDPFATFRWRDAAGAWNDVPANDLTARWAAEQIESLQVILDHTPPGTPFLSSAVVCLSDARHLMANGDYQHALDRAAHGAEYLVGRAA